MLSSTLKQKFDELLIRTLFEKLSYPGIVPDRPVSRKVKTAATSGFSQILV